MRTCEHCQRPKPLDEFQSIRHPSEPTIRCQHCRDLLARRERELREEAIATSAPLPPHGSRIYAAVCLMCAGRQWFHIKPVQARLISASGLLKGCPQCRGPRYLEEVDAAGPGGVGRYGDKYSVYDEAA